MSQTWGGLPTTAECQPGDVLGDLRLIDRLGKGGMGTVFRAEPVAGGDPVAVKVLSPQLAEDPALVRRFHREASAMATIRHPNVVGYHRSAESDGQTFIVLELIAGGDVRALVERTGGALDELHALELIRDACLGLGAIHAAGLIHRDIKPANIFIDAEGRAKLADLGLVRAEGGGQTTAALTRAGALIGTTAYMCPEQAEGEADLDGRVDLYALGATLFELLVGEPPYGKGSTVSILKRLFSEPVPDPRARRPELSDASAAVVMRALAKERDARPASATGLLAELEAAIQALSFEPILDEGDAPPITVAAITKMAESRAIAEANDELAATPAPTPAPAPTPEVEAEADAETEAEAAPKPVARPTPKRRSKRISERRPAPPAARSGPSTGLLLAVAGPVAALVAATAFIAYLKSGPATPVPETVEAPVVAEPEIAPSTLDDEPVERPAWATAEMRERGADEDRAEDGDAPEREVGAWIGGPDGELRPRAKPPAQDAAWSDDGPTRTPNRTLFPGRPTEPLDDDADDGADDGADDDESRTVFPPGRSGR